MLDISAPENGYTTDAKQKYREAVWSCLLPAWHEAKSDDRAHLLIMPSREGLEIDYLVLMGVPQERIIAIDKSAAVIATSRWRKEFPQVKFFSTEVGDAYKKINAKGYVIACANLDYCTNFSTDFVEQTKNFISNVARFNFFRFGVTVAKGREGSALTLMLKKFSPSVCDVISEPRIASLFALTGLTGFGVCGEGKYTSGKNPMAWGVFKYLAADKNELRDKHVSELSELLSGLAKKHASDNEIDKAAGDIIKVYVHRFQEWKSRNRPIEKINPSSPLHSGWDMSKMRETLVSDHIINEAKNTSYRLSQGMPPTSARTKLQWIDLNA